jgi:hypothetical protein
LGYVPKDIEKIKPHLDEEELDDELFKIKRNFDRNTKKEIQKTVTKLDNKTISDREYIEEISKNISRISDSNKSDLAEYVLHRKIIIELFERGIEIINKNKNETEPDKYNKEEYIHNLIYPQRTSSEALPYENHNLWLIDERLSYCQYISSDIPINNGSDRKRPDILFLDKPVALSESKNNGTEFDTIIIIELKRPMRTDYTMEENPIKQLLEYVQKIRDGNVKDVNGRSIRVSDKTKFYLYAICDMSKKLEDILSMFGYSSTPDKLGYFHYNNALKVYIEVITFDKLINNSKKRNEILFDKLGI